MTGEESLETFWPKRRSKPIDSGPNLVWSPIGQQLVECCSSEGGIRLLIAPFIQRHALARLLDSLDVKTGLKIITRWRAEDILSGVSDPFVYEECAERNASLYLHQDIHLKVLVMGSGACFCGSANVTGKGLGFEQAGNVEAGVLTVAALGDWKKLYEIIENSCLVGDATFEAAIDYREKYFRAKTTVPPLDLPSASPALEFNLACLPATLNPEDVLLIFDDYMNREPQEIGRMMHDLLMYSDTDSLNANNLLVAMGKRFTEQPCVKMIIETIEKSGSLSFGELTEWVHNHCSDVPLPYRSEIKEAVGVLYNWLDYYVPEISWSVPGKHSQVIEWHRRTNF